MGERPGRRTGAVLVATAALVAACDQGADESDARGWERVDEQPVTPPAEALVSPMWLATDPASLQEGWTRFGLEGDPPDLDLEARLALLVDTPGHEDCPRDITDVAMHAEPAVPVPPDEEDVQALDRHLEIEVLRARDHDEPCRGGPAPRVQVLAVDRASLEGGPFDVRLGGYHDGASAYSVTPLDEPPALAAHADHDLRLDPQTVPSGQPVAAHIDLGPPTEPRGDEDHHLAQPSGAIEAELAAWRGHQWTAIDPSVVTEASGNGDDEAIAHVDTDDLEPAWYRLRLEIDIPGDEFASAQRPAAVFTVDGDAE